MEFNGEISATYADGVLKPDHRLSLPEGTRVTVSVARAGPTEESRKRGWAVIDRVRREKLIVLRGMRWTRDDLYDRR